MQFLFVFLLMIGIVIGCHHHMSNRPPRKIIQVIEFRPLTVPQTQSTPEADTDTEINAEDIRDLPDPAPETTPAAKPWKIPFFQNDQHPMWPF